MNGSSYSSRQSERDAEYDKAYRAWVASLPESERRSLAEQGLESPSIQRYGKGGASGDAADSPWMREGDDPALLPEPEEAPEPEEVPESCDTETVWTALRRVLGEILNHDNARLTAECIALVSGLSYSGSSMADIARRHGITRAAVSKRCVELTALLDLRPSRAMRSLTARKSYRAARIRSLSKP